MSELGALWAIVGLAVITVITRGFFLIPRRELPIPTWLREGLRYAPLAALVAVAVPEIVMTQGALIDTWKDPRPYAALVGALWYWKRRDVLGTIVAGFLTLVALRLVWGG